MSDRSDGTLGRNEDGSQPVGTGFTVWLTGLSGSGKSTLGRSLAAEIEGRGRRVEFLDGDLIRAHLSRELGFSKEDRDTHVERLGWFASRLMRHGAVVVVAAISPYNAARATARALAEENGAFVEVWVKATADECARRDVKGLYARAYAGEIKQFTGVSDPYEPPTQPEVVTDTESQNPEEGLSLVLETLERLGLLPPVGRESHA